MRMLQLAVLVRIQADFFFKILISGFHMLESLIHEIDTAQQELNTLRDISPKVHCKGIKATIHPLSNPQHSTLEPPTLYPGTLDL